MTSDNWTCFCLGIIIGCVAMLLLEFVFSEKDPKAIDIVEGRAWVEYTSDGKRHWVRKEEK